MTKHVTHSALMAAPSCFILLLGIKRLRAVISVVSQHQESLAKAVCTDRNKISGKQPGTAGPDASAG